MIYLISQASYIKVSSIIQTIIRTSYMAGINKTWTLHSGLIKNIDFA